MPHPRRQDGAGALSGQRVVPRHSFKRKFEPDLETRFRDFLAAVPQARDSILEPSRLAGPSCKAASSASPLGVALVIGRVVGRGTPQDVVLPVESEVLLEARHRDMRSIAADAVDAFLGFLDARSCRATASFQTSPTRRCHCYEDSWTTALLPTRHHPQRLTDMPHCFVRSTNSFQEKQPNERRWGSVSFERRQSVRLLLAHLLTSSSQECGFMQLASRRDFLLPPQQVALPTEAQSS